MNPAELSGARDDGAHERVERMVGADELVCERPEVDPRILRDLGKQSLPCVGVRLLALRVEPPGA